MALLDYMFNPATYGGLLGGPQWQRPQEDARAAFDMPTSSYQFGGQMVPVYGQAPQPQATELSAQSRMPQAAPQPAPMAAPQPQQPNRMQAGFEGFVENAHTGPMGALLGAMMGYSGGGSGNVTERALVSRGLDRDTARAAIRNPTLMAAIAPTLFGTKDKTDDIREFEYAKSQGFTGTLEQWIQRKRAGAGEYGLQAIWGVDDKGNPALVQLGKSGEAIQSKLPDGFKPAKDPIKIDMGTHWGIMDPQTRQFVGTAPKNIAEEAAQRKIGAGQGDAAESYASIQSKMPGLEKVVKELDDLSNKATYTLAGRTIDAAMRQAGMEPRDSAVARARYTAMVDNQILPLLRDTFGAQFTQAEGQTLRETLGDPNKSPAEKQAVLKAFIEQKRRDVEALKSRVAPSQQAAPAASQPTIRKYNPATGQIE